MDAENEQRPLLRVGISHGDVNGIGYEIILKSLSDPRMMELFTPVVYGSSKVASYHKKSIGGADVHFHIIRSADQAQEGKANLINIVPGEIKLDLGQSTDLAGQMALRSLEWATADLQKGLIDALVTAPINKNNIQGPDFDFPGHTEYLANKFDAADSLMLMVSQQIRIGVITGHIPLSQVPERISQEAILGKLRLMHRSLLRDFGIQKPRMALLGLNPHAGDEGVIGQEEQKAIIPAIRAAFDEGMLAFGPYSADGFFGSSAFTQFDGILAMYHDQGLIPFKTLSFKSGVNYTAGLPVVRTSPAHGTAYELAGKNQASPDAFREALFLAMDVVWNRRMHDEASSNPLKISVLEDDSDADKHSLKNLPEDND